VHEASRLLQAMHLTAHVWTLEIMLPAGISFFTFHALSYTIDVYRRDTPVCRSFTDFALFISFFPQLVAGPINRSTQLLPQVGKPRTKLDEVRFRQGLYLVLTGLFLKVVVADNMAWLADHVFRVPAASLQARRCCWACMRLPSKSMAISRATSSIACGTAVWLGFDLMTQFSAALLRFETRAISGRAGTSACPPGCAITSTFLSVATATANGERSATCC